MALVVFFQEDEDVPSVYRNLKIFCETAPLSVARQKSCSVRPVSDAISQKFLNIFKMLGRPHTTRS